MKTKHPPRKRHARPLLVAVGLTTTLAGCPSQGPFGNLMSLPTQDLSMPDLSTPPDQSFVPPDGPFGNLMVPPPDMKDGGTGDGGSDGGRG